MHGKRNCKTPTRHSLHTSIIRDISAGLLFTWQTKKKRSQQPRHQCGFIRPFCSFPSFSTRHQINTSSYRKKLTVWKAQSRQKPALHLWVWKKERKCSLHCWTFIVLAAPQATLRSLLKKTSQEKPLPTGATPSLTTEHFLLKGSKIHGMLCLRKRNVTNTLTWVFFGN